ncbi:rhodanese-like domain-containing protein, partial [Pseudomonas guariconensis]|uniref:rhodanese-like domain-containing protein n=1 Tax=Pseudomonas guariconensis TaxID=1288410 RepID=UPI0034D799C7
CAQIGSVMVNEAIKLITGIGTTLLGRVLVFNALQMGWRELKVRKDPLGEPITELADYESVSGVGPAPAVDAEHSVSAAELAELEQTRRDGGAEFELIDVREPGEYEIVSIPGAKLLPKGRILAGEAGTELPRDRDLIFHCKSGARSA